MITIDDSELSKPFITPLCLICSRVEGIGEPKKCKAFPEGIPPQILLGDFIHTEQFADEEFLFEPIEVK